MVMKRERDFRPVSRFLPLNSFTWDASTAMSLLEQTMLTILVSFTIGVFVAYSLWGIRYFRVLDAESATALAKQNRARQLEHHASLEARLQEL